MSVIIGLTQIFFVVFLIFFQFHPLTLSYLIIESYNFIYFALTDLPRYHDKVAYLVHYSGWAQIFFLLLYFLSLYFFIYII
jgi:hypothetical protein